MNLRLPHIGSGLLRATVLGVLLAGLGYTCSQQLTSSKEDQFTKHIRTTEAQTPEQERAGFQLPQGFEIQLFASEPNIGKPLNMTFDAKGRMWLTQSYEYPFADTTGVGKDQISILEDTDGDGVADKFTVFADSLNIPIGIVAMPDGAIAYSIPHIYHFKDTDGDDKVDERKILYSGFEYKDTHGMINNLIRSWDGWIHAGHGFSNTSRVAGTDGDTIVMFSGNTFRIRKDGSRVEFTTTGRVNPFGYAYDEMGYTYSVDCHTSPIYQLVRGADYPHFGKQPTGIGFGPAMMSHDHRATALAGLEYYLATQFPEEYQESFYLGDVVKSRVYRSKIEMNGTTPINHWQDDFVVSNDPWFRPVDVKMGPDGALYIADFYNRIIGHYEVSLDHPGRDRQRGRIWRITYKGEDYQVEVPKRDLSTENLEILISELDNENLPLRMATADQIVDRFGAEAVQPIVDMLNNTNTDSQSYVQGLWILFRLNALTKDHLAAAVQHEDATINVHALRIMYEDNDLDESLRKIAANLLETPNVHIQRQAVMVVAKNPSLEHIPALVKLRNTVDQEDSHFFYSIRQCLRDHARDDKIMAHIHSNSWNEEEARAWADVMMGVDNFQAGQFLLNHLQQYEQPQDQLIKYTKHTARYLQPSALDKLVSAVQSQTKGDLDLAYTLFNSIRDGLAQGGKEMSPRGKKWGISLASSFLNEDIQAGMNWQIVPNVHLPFSSNPVRLIQTKTLDEAPDSITMLSSSAVKSGRDISTLISPAFSMPQALEFYVFGQKNEPGEEETPTPPDNRVELRLTETNEVIVSKYVEVPDMKEKILWEAGENKGKEVYLALVDASGKWGEFVAIGGLDPAVVPLPISSPNQIAERQIFAASIAKSYKANDLEGSLQTLLSTSNADIYARVAAADALLTLNENKYITQVADLMEKKEASPLLKEKLIGVVSELSSAQALTAIKQAMPDLSYKAQKDVALKMVGTSAGIDQLLQASEQMMVSPRLLLDRQVYERLAEVMNATQQTKFEEITANIKPMGEETQALIEKRLEGFGKAKPSRENGSLVFNQNCAVCHQIGGQGGNIGPQLDGIGNWGQLALTEKILDPNRNISRAFINYSLTLNDGKITTGLFRREEGEVMVFANMAGEEFSIPKAEIKEQKIAPYTLMPDHFGEVISEEDYYDLMGYLLSLK